MGGLSFDGKRRGVKNLMPDMLECDSEGSGPAGCRLIYLVGKKLEMAVGGW